MPVSHAGYEHPTLVGLNLAGREMIDLSVTGLRDYEANYVGMILDWHGSTRFGEAKRSAEKLTWDLRKTSQRSWALKINQNVTINFVEKKRKGIDKIAIGKIEYENCRC